jgi:hypothetical protein
MYVCSKSKLPTISPPVLYLSLSYRQYRVIARGTPLATAVITRPPTDVRVVHIDSTDERLRTGAGLHVVTSVAVTASNLHADDDDNVVIENMFTIHTYIYMHIKMNICLTTMSLSHRKFGLSSVSEVP